ncbi:MAG TPA: type II CAAX endopeptidase family protein [Candidatus Acidoferrales bacterium]|nr:type II CAAX endopeptidase family protein [Candidatus Acidoferrales bacterium]
MPNGEGENAAAVTAPGGIRAMPVAPIWHTVLLIVVLFGLAAFQGQGRLAARAARRPNLLLTYALTICYEWLLVAYVWFFGLRRSKTSLREIVGGRWQRWGDFWRDIGVALLFWVVAVSVLAALSYPLHFQGGEAAKFLLPQTTAELTIWVALTSSAGFCEELVFRGYLQRQFLSWTGSVTAGVALQAIVFGVAHLYQGWRAVLVISVYGALFGVLAVMRKSLRPGMLQHAGQDTFAGFANHLLTKYKFVHLVRF